MSCFFLELGYVPCLYRADARPDRVHWIPQQRLKREGVTDVWDERLWGEGCRRHHHLFDSKRITLRREQYPQPLLDWADENGWFYAERAGWLKEFDSNEREAA